MSSFNLYRKKMEASTQCAARYESLFITEGSASTIIHAERTNVDKQAALTINEKEGPDTVIIFTQKEDNTHHELLKTDYFT